jgi:hypothetical protein
MGAVYQMASDSPDELSLDLDNKTGSFQGFSLFLPKLKRLRVFCDIIIEPMRTDAFLVSIQS